MIPTEIPQEPGVVISPVKYYGSDLNKQAQLYNLTLEAPLNIDNFTLDHYELEVEPNKIEYIWRIETFKLFSISSEHATINENLTVRVTAVSTCGKKGRTKYVPLSTTGLTSSNANQSTFNVNCHERTCTYCIPLVIVLSVIVIILALIIIIILFCRSRTSQLNIHQLKNKSDDSTN